MQLHRFRDSVGEEKQLVAVKESLPLFRTFPGTPLKVSFNKRGEKGEESKGCHLRDTSHTKKALMFEVSHALKFIFKWPRCC